MSDSALPSDSAHALYREHHGWLRAWLSRRLGCTHTAADLTQDAFLAVLRAGNAAEIREPRSFLATIADRLVLQRHRRRQIEAAYLQALAVMPEELAPSPEARLLALEALLAIDRALDGLPAPVREAFLLANLEGWSYAQIAEQLKVSPSSVKQYLSRANRQCYFALES